MQRFDITAAYSKKLMESKMSAVFNRPLPDFKGDSVVIGCSQYHSFCKKKLLLHADSNFFYSIDSDKKQKADFVYDIGNPLPSEFKNRFHLTLLEDIDFTAYSDADEYSYGHKMN